MPFLFCLDLSLQGFLFLLLHQPFGKPFAFAIVFSGFSFCTGWLIHGGLLDSNNNNNSCCCYYYPESILHCKYLTRWWWWWSLAIKSCNCNWISRVSSSWFSMQASWLTPCSCSWWGFFFSFIFCTGWLILHSKHLPRISRVSSSSNLWRILTCNFPLDVLQRLIVADWFFQTPTATTQNPLGRVSSWQESGNLKLQLAMYFSSAIKTLKIICLDLGFLAINFGESFDMQFLLDILCRLIMAEYLVSLNSTTTQKISYSIGSWQGHHHHHPNEIRNEESCNIIMLEPMMCFAAFNTFCLDLLFSQWPLEMLWQVISAW